MVGQPDATMQPAPQDHQLMSKHHVLSSKPQLRLEWRGQDGQNETEQPDHSANLGDSITASTRIRFSVHTTPLLHVRNDFWHNDKDSIRERLRIAEDALTAWPHGYHRYLDQLRSIRHDKMEYLLPGKRALDRE